MCSVVNVICIYFLPETSQGEIPDTIEEALKRYGTPRERKNKNIGNNEANLELVGEMKSRQSES